MRFDIKAQKEDNSGGNNLPLIGTWAKEADLEKENMPRLIIAAFWSKKQDWFIINTKTYAVLIHSQSRQLAYVLGLLEECFDKGVPLACKWSNETKSQAIFAIWDKAIPDGYKGYGWTYKIRSYDPFSVISCEFKEQRSLYDAACNVASNFEGDLVDESNIPY